MASRKHQKITQSNLRGFFKIPEPVNIQTVPTGIPNESDTQEIVGKEHATTDSMETNTNQPNKSGRWYNFQEEWMNGDADRKKFNFYPWLFRIPVEDNLTKDVFGCKYCSAFLIACSLQP
jgi:hypothetical protein